MSLYFRLYPNSGLTTIYATDVDIAYQIDWVLVAMGGSDACVIL
jgi:hypothetical protein